MVFTDTVPPEKVKPLRGLMRELLADARKQVHEAKTQNGLTIGRSQLNFVCDLLEALGWDDREHEVDVPLEPFREALRVHIVRERELMAHVVYDRKAGERYMAKCEAMLAAFTPEDES